MSYKAAVIGDSQSALGFAALGLTVRTANDAKQASDALYELEKDGCIIIYITEQLAALIPQTLEKFVLNPNVSVIPIPSGKGTLGIGERALHSAVERAVGADIIKDK